MSEQVEQWRPARYLKQSSELIYFEGVEVSSFGRVRRVSDGFEYKQNKNKKGYLRCAKGPIHRLVLSSFSDNTNGLLQVNHKDEDKTNNNLENLEWLTCQENNNYGVHNARVRASLKGKSTWNKGKHWMLNSDGKRVYY